MNIKNYIMFLRKFDSPQNPVPHPCDVCLCRKGGDTTTVYHPGLLTMPTRKKDGRLAAPDFADLDPLRDPSRKRANA